MEQSSLQPLLVDDRGHEGFPQATLGNGSFFDRPLKTGGPGHSTTFTEVPLGLGLVIWISLTFLAKVEFLVAGMVKVAIAPDPLNQTDLSSLRVWLLSSIVLYIGLMQI